MNILIIGNKCTGKSVLENELKRIYGFKKIVSYTTRNPRLDEVDGVDYHFINEVEFVERTMNEEFIESVNNYGSWYGILKKDLLNEENNVLVVERKGLQQILSKSNRNNYFIVKLTCDFNEQIYRMLERNDNNVSVDVITDNKYVKLIKSIEMLREDNDNLSQGYSFDIEINTQTVDIHEETFKIMKAYHLKQDMLERANNEKNKI